MHPRIITNLAPGAVGVLRPFPGHRQHTFWTSHQFMLTVSLELHVFGMWEEARVSGESPCRHTENMQTPRRKARPRIHQRREVAPLHCSHVAIKSSVQIKLSCVFSFLLILK